MALIKIPLRNDLPAYEFKVDLDGTTYTMKIRFNTRMETWIADLQTNNGVPIISGVPLLVGTLFFNRFKNDLLPEGDMFVLNIEDENVEATRESLNDNVLLLYNEAS